MRIILVILLLAGCASAPHYARKFHEYKVGNKAEAEEIFRKKLQFLQLTYEQIEVPDLLATKFRTDCLRAIHIDSIHESGAGLSSVSELYFSPGYGTGLCPEVPNARKGYFVLLYCQKKNLVYQISCFSDDCSGIRWNKEC